MRIISGEFKGRVFNPPSNLRVRPTTDRAKESLFNILNNYVDFGELGVLDLFAGTGNMSYEFLSRGVDHITLVERDATCIRFIHKTLDKLGISNAEVLRRDAFKFIERCRNKFDLIFADPPYGMEQLSEIPSLIRQYQLLKQDGMLIIEHGSKTNFEKEPGFYQKRNAGEVNFSIFIL